MYYDVWFYRYDLCIYGDRRGGGGIFWPRRLRDPWHSLFGLRFCFLGAANKFNVVGFAIATVGILEIRFCS